MYKLQNNENMVFNKARLQIIRMKGTKRDKGTDPWSHFFKKNYVRLANDKTLFFFTQGFYG